MYGQQQNPQPPSNQQQQQQQLPEHRRDEMAERLRRMELENQQLRGQIDTIMRMQQKPGQAQPQESPFKPEVRQALQQEVQALLDQQAVQYRQQIGMLMDRTDELNYQLKYGSDKYKKFHPKVEELRAQELARGNYVSREDALRYVYFEETGSKVSADPGQQPTPPPKREPYFDPYFGKMVDPLTGKPLTEPPQGYAPPEQEEHPGMPWQQPAQQQPAQQQPQPQFQSPSATGFHQNQQHQTMPQGFGNQQQPQSYNPMMNPYGLPPQGVNQPAATPGTQGQRQAPRALSLEASDAELRAFEDSFGDVTF